MADVAEIEKDGVCLRFYQPSDLSSGIGGARNGTQNQGMVKGHYQRAAVVPEDPTQPDLLAKISQAISPGETLQYWGM
jgi:hypothetical protein